MNTIDKVNNLILDQRRPEKKAYTIYLDDNTEKMLKNICTNLNVSRSIAIDGLIRVAHAEM